MSKFVCDIESYCIILNYSQNCKVCCSTIDSYWFYNITIHIIYPALSVALLNVYSNYNSIVKCDTAL